MNLSVVQVVVELIFAVGVVSDSFFRLGNRVRTFPHNEVWRLTNLAVLSRDFQEFDFFFRFGARDE